MLVSNVIVGILESTVGVGCTYDFSVALETARAEAYHSLVQRPVSVPCVPHLEHINITFKWSSKNFKHVLPGMFNSIF